ncbi:MAG: hypothetical protein QM751_07290 [Paludibacteraceae bacterium]
MNAAREMSRAGMSTSAYLAAHPREAEAYAKDAAFHEGFNAYVLHQGQGIAGRGPLRSNTALDQRDGWYAQAQVAVRA